MTMLSYERYSKDVWKMIHCFEGEKVLVCHAFRWHLNGSVVSNGYEMFEPEQICSERGWEIVQKLSEHIVIVRTGEVE